MKNLPGKTPSESAVVMTQAVLPQHTNPQGTIFGGVIMSWMDIAAGICAQRHSRMNVVTASVDALHFLSPVRLGWVVTLMASVNHARRSSCEVGVRIEAENSLTGETFHTASAYFTMVALGSDLKPAAIPPIIPETELEKKRFEAAATRWEERLRQRKTAIEDG